MDDFEKDDLEEKPLEGEDLVNSCAPTFDDDKDLLKWKEHFQKFNHDLGKDYLSFLGDPIYDTSNEGSVDFEAFGQPHMDEAASEFSHVHFQPSISTNDVDLEKHEGVFCHFDADLGKPCFPSSRANLDHYFQPYSSVISAGLGQQNDVLFAVLE